MHTNIDQRAIDEKIQHFMARRSSVRTLSKVLADRFHHAKNWKSPIKGVTYESLHWTRTAR